MSEAKPCPHCGSTDILFTGHGAIGRGPIHRGAHVWSMGCYICGATFPNMYNEEALLKVWNRRVPPDPDTVARLRRVLKLLDLDKAVPQDDAALMDVLFSVLGTIASTIERRAAVKPVTDPRRVVGLLRRIRPSDSVTVLQGMDVRTQRRLIDEAMDLLLSGPAAEREPSASETDWLNNNDERGLI